MAPAETARLCADSANGSCAMDQVRPRIFGIQVIGGCDDRSVWMRDLRYRAEIFVVNHVVVRQIRVTLGGLRPLVKIVSHG